MKTEQSELAVDNQVTDCPLFVDLDGTLVNGDTLLEGMVALVRTNPLALLQAAWAGRKGLPLFKRQVVENSPVTADDFLYHQDVLDFIRTQQELRPVILATASDRHTAEAVAAKIGGFTGVIATDETVNLKGRGKLTRIKEWLSENGYGPEFDYLGDHAADRPIWSAAGRAIVVAPQKKTAQALSQGVPVTAHLASENATPKDYVRAMRPHQWVKNVLIFLPILLAQEWANLPLLGLALIGFVSFSLCASATYIWNDILDLRADRRHPTKRRRPFASGRISLPSGIAFSLVLLFAALALAFFTVGWALAAMLVGYVILTVSYSVWLKRKLLLDVILLAGLYGYRIAIGGVVTGIVVSDWLIAFSVFFFFGLALVKRYTELAGTEVEAGKKVSSRGYYQSDREVVGVVGVVSGFVAVLVMALYINSPEVAEQYNRPQILWVVCLMLLYWMPRVWFLAHRGQMNDDPIVFALKDRVSLLCGIVSAAGVLAAAA